MSASPQRQQLVDMGFEPARIDWAMHEVGPDDVQRITEHIINHQEKPVPDYQSKQATTTSATTTTGANRPSVDEEYDAEDQAALADMFAKRGQGAQDTMLADAAASAKSIKCVDCGKLLKSVDFANYHAEKSGHTNFEESTEEIKPLTEEERKQRLDEMRAKLAAKRQVQAKKDAEEAKQNEKIRRKAGQDMSLVRDELQKKEAIKEAEKRRKEAQADAEAKRRVREQIEADKRERAAKSAREKALREGGGAAVDVGSDAVPRTAPTAAAAAASSGSTTTTATEARLRVRAPGGMWMGNALPVETTLRQVESMIIDDGKASGPLKFSTTFPRKQFSDADKDKDLKQLGLVPSAALEAAPA